MTAEPDTEIDRDELAALKDIALAGALDQTLSLTADELADRLDAPRQAALGRVRRLRDAGYLALRDGDESRRMRVTDGGRTVLAREFAEYCRLFAPASPLRLTGSVTEGVGKARQFISLPGYIEQFRKQLGYEPFHGTLNVDVDAEDEADSYRLAALDGVRVDGWESDGRTYGGVTCYLARIETADERRYDPAHVLVPDRTRHDASELEILAPNKLRDELDLCDGDRVTVHVST